MTTSPTNNLPRPIGSSIPSRRQLKSHHESSTGRQLPLSSPVHLVMREIDMNPQQPLSRYATDKHHSESTVVLKRRESSRFNVPLVEMHQSVEGTLDLDSNVDEVPESRTTEERFASPTRIRVDTTQRSLSRGRTRSSENIVDGHSESPNPPPRLSMGSTGRRSLGAANTSAGSTLRSTIETAARAPSPRSPLARLSSFNATTSTTLKTHEHILDHTTQMPHLQSSFQRRHSLSPLRNSRQRLETIKNTLHEQHERLSDRIHRIDREIQEMVKRKESAEDERERIKEQIKDISEQMSRLEEELEHESKINTALRLVNRSQQHKTSTSLDASLSHPTDTSIHFNVHNNQVNSSSPHQYIVCSYENFREGRVTLFDMMEAESVHCRPHEKASAFLLRHPLMTNSFITATNNDIMLHDAFRTEDHVQVQTRRFHVNPRSHFNHGCTYGRENILITCGRDDNAPCVRIWDLNTRHCQSVLTQENESVLDPMMKCCALPTRELVATSCRDGTITVWDLESQSVLTSWKKDEPKGLIKSLLFDPDTPLLYTVVESGVAIDCWDIREPHSRPSFTLENNQKQFRFNHLCLDSSRHRLFSGGDAVHRWDLILRKTIATFPDIKAPVKQLEYLPSGELLVLEEDCVKLVNSDNGIVNTQYDFDSNVVCAVNQVAVI